jgi:phosphoadenylyl-sulfate reductase (thioredoxin)
MKSATAGLAAEGRPLSLDQAAAELELCPAEEILAWASRTYGPKIALATAFGLEGCCLTHIIAVHGLPIEIFTLDTGLFFAETNQLWQALENKYQIKIRGVSSELSLADQEREWGPELWRSLPDQCCRLRKVLPLERHVAGLDAWVSAIRRDQTPERAKAKVVEFDSRFKLVKINPLVRWTAEDVKQFITANKIPYNSLHERGYPSIGCTPCTTAVAPGEDPRSGRWRGQGKIECGLHGRFTANNNGSNEP